MSRWNDRDPDFCTWDRYDLQKGCNPYFHAVCDLETKQLLYSGEFPPDKLNAARSPDKWVDILRLPRSSGIHRIVYLRGLNGSLSTQGCVVGQKCPHICKEHPDQLVVCNNALDADSCPKPCPGPWPCGDFEPTKPELLHPFKAEMGTASLLYLECTTRPCCRKWEERSGRFRCGHSFL
eukprot:TRINITY_DN65617_c0_g1_i1.p1 TRINITY_DN65617_c0_g1~~TRINITY_DN65617_c0_g1_i1.p1  ORF type:complete len:179 (-),score=16.62 TRINITY_DN65617_c0_g1_i1:122-658(-)